MCLFPVLTGGNPGLLLEEADEGRHIGHAHPGTHNLHRFIGLRQESAGFFFALRLHIFQNA